VVDVAPASRIVLYQIVSVDFYTIYRIIGIVSKHSKHVVIQGSERFGEMIKFVKWLLYILLYYLCTFFFL